VKYLYLSLLLTFSCPILGFDRGFDPDNGVQETKGGPQVASPNLEFRLDETDFSIPPRIINQFELLSQLAENGSEDTSLPEKYPFTAKNLRLLLKFLTDHETKKLSLTQQSDLLNLADYLDIKNWGLMSPILEQIQSKATLANLGKLSLPKITILKPKPHVLHDTQQIYWSPTGDQYVVRFGHKKAQLYNAAGEPQGNLLRDVHDIEWSAKGDRYMVLFERGRTAQLYKATGEPQGNLLQRIHHIYWSPKGDRYAVKRFSDRDICEIVEFYNMDGDQQQNNVLKKVRSVSWSPNSGQYWVIFNNLQAQLYNAAGKPYGRSFDKAYALLGIQRPGIILSNVLRIQWSPNGDKYAVTFDDHSIQIYNSSGHQLETTLRGVSDISWSPKSDRFVAQYNDYGAQLYNAAGEQLSGIIRKGYGINWSPKGDRFWVKFYNHQSQLHNIQLYSSAGKPQSERLDNVANITWLPNGKGSMIDFRDPEYHYQTQIYNTDGVMQGVLPEGTTISWSPSADRYAMRFNNGDMRIEHIYDDLLENLNFGQRLLVQTILNEHDITGAPVTVDANLLIKYELPKSVYKKLLEKRLISVKNSYLNNWNTMTKNLALTARLAAQSPTFSKAMKLPRKPS